MFQRQAISLFPCCSQVHRGKGRLPADCSLLLFKRATACPELLERVWGSLGELSEGPVPVSTTEREPRFPGDVVSISPTERQKGRRGPWGGVYPMLTTLLFWGLRQEDPESLSPKKKRKVKEKGKKGGKAPLSCLSHLSPCDTLRSPLSPLTHTCQRESGLKSKINRREGGSGGTFQR